METFKTIKLADPFDSSPSAKSSCSSYSDSEQEDFVPTQHREPLSRQRTVCQMPSIKRSTSGPRKYQLAKMQRKAARESLRRDARAQQDAHYLFNGLYPHKHLQERFYTILPFLARHGFDLIPRLYDSIHTNCPDHHILFLGLH